MDYAACGYPDLSYHGQSAWKPRTEGYFRYIGQMYCGKYARTDEQGEDSHAEEYPRSSRSALLGLLVPW